MDSASETAGEDFSDQLERWLRADGSKTLGALATAFEEKGFAVAILLLMLPSSLPLPTGGVTHIFEAITMLLAFEMVLGRQTLWLPKRLRDRELGAATTGKAIPFVIRRVRWFERYSRPRWARLFDQRWFLRVLGLVVMVLTVGAIVAPPFSGLDTLPSFGVVVIALGILLNDVVFVLAGTIVGTGGLVLIVTIGRAAANFVRDLF